MKFLLPLVLFVCSLSSAQEDIVLQGLINNEINDKDFISVVNVTSNKGTITDKQGAFSITVRENDIIDISALQYKNVKFIVTEQMVNEKRVYITLESETTILPEMTISTAVLSGNLSKDVSGALGKKPVVNDQFLGEPRRIPTPAERRLYTATTRGEDLVEDRTDLRFDIPLAAVSNAISGRTKKIKTLINKERALMQVVALENKFPPNFFTEALEIEVSKIEDFLFYAQVVNETVYNHQSENALELVRALVKVAPKYKALGEDSEPQKN